MRVGTLIDKLIAPVAPVWARKRALARLQFDRLSSSVERHYEASKIDRLSYRAKATTRGPIERSRKDLVVTRARAWELYHTNPYAAGAVDSITANLIGCGILPMPRVVMQRRRGGKRRVDEAANRQLLELWKEWAEHADVTGRESYYQIQALVMRERTVAGEGIIRKRMIDTRERRIPLALEVVPSERLAHDRDDETRDRAGNLARRIVQGVEFDGQGQIVAYWIHPNHPTDGGYSALFTSRPVRVPASEILHTFHRRQAGQVRGMTPFTRAAHVLEALSHYLNSELTRADIASSVVFAAYKEDLGLTFPLTGETPEGEDELGNEEGLIEPGSIWRGRTPDERLDVLSPAVTSPAVEPFVRLHLRSLARAFNVSYELLARDLSKVTYLSARQGEQEDRRHWEPQQEDFNSEINSPVWSEFTAAADVVGLLPVERERALSVDFIRPARTWVDPVKDITAMVEAIKAGLESPLEIIRAHGGDPRQILDDVAEFQAMADERGLELSVFLDALAAAKSRQEGVAA